MIGMRLFLPLLVSMLVACGSPEAAQEQNEAQPKSDSLVQPAQLQDGHQVIATQDGGRMEGFLREGQREGPWVSYFAHGGVRSRSNYVDGVEDGPTEVYQENGMTYYTGQYRQGKTVGEWIFYDPQGKELKRVEYDSLGVRLK